MLATSANATHSSKVACTSAASSHSPSEGAGEDRSATAAANAQCKSPAACSKSRSCRDANSGLDSNTCTG